ncbi:SDR family NAD(P)-dependent oxidoreductase [Phytohabitans suffuscus]|uniref:3-oxoacyl-ACP reductase n=1 Tax=Phytohabitans suffuscus TaxID=624315 RepID=A0A6F8YES0_9ACTN|nr:SDR family oxidoreductase [Phytohabitans suffuscus]BCB84523.1 3-oxoacyl-ACP reductase [Phytohabitans suffuscus]
MSVATVHYGLEGRHALVTGASRGIGRAVASTLARNGAEVTCVGRHADTLEAAVKEIVAAGGRATAAPGDVTDRAFLERLVADGPVVDILVNNAGVNFVEPLIDVSYEHIEAILATNVAAVAYLSSLVAARMVAAERPGVIISVSSAQAHVGASGRAVYSASKHAVEGLTKSMALELAPSGIRAVTVAPTFTYTEMTAKRLDNPEFRSQVEESIPLGRVAAPAEIAEAVAWLASPAASFVTGSSLLLDGGFTAR